jgi:hypothetical protein
MLESPMQLLADPEEGPFARPFFAGTAGAAERAAYRDWLVARGDVRGEVLALLDALVAPAPPPDGAAQRARLAALEPEVPDWWLEMVRGVAGVFNCGRGPDAAPAVRFAFECPRRWETLEATADARVRRCGDCGENVTLCETLEDAEAAARRGACITVPVRVTHRAWSEYTKMITGRPHLPSVWGRRIFDAK